MINNRNIFIVSTLLLFNFMQCLFRIPSPVPTNILFLVLGTIVVLSELGKGPYKVNPICVWFLAGIILSIIANNIPPFFKPWQRLTQFLFLFIAGSPLINGENVDRVRRQMFMGVLWSCGLIGAGSFLAFITGQGRYLSGIIAGYMGITPHPNFLGMYCIIALVFFASFFFRSTNTVERVIWGGCWVGTLIALLLSASRASTACGLLGTAIVVYLRLQASPGKLMTAVSVVIGLVIVSLPYLIPFMGTMLQKGVSLEEGESDELVAATRGGIWDIRFAEINESPLVGVGAFSCDIHLPHAQVYYVAETGTVEQGSSYLGLLAQIGWIGFAPFVLLLALSFWKSFRYATKERTPYAQLLLAMMVPLLIHMIVEGYAITAGAVQCVILWFIISAAHLCDKVADYPVFWEKNDPITPEEYVVWRDEHNK